MFVRVCLPDVKSINYFSAQRKPDAVGRLEEIYSFWPPRLASELNYISSERYFSWDEIRGVK